MIQPVPTRTSRTFWTFLFSYPDRRRSQALDYRSSIICHSRPFISEHIKVSKRRIIYRLPPPPLRLTAVTVITSKLPAISRKDVYCSLSPDRAAAIPWPRSSRKNQRGGGGGIGDGWMGIIVFFNCDLYAPSCPSRGQCFYQRSLYIPISKF
jgi:hypothetical protein